MAGNREPLPGGESAPVDPAGRKAEDLAAHQTRRFQIYVHSKLMIVDDEVRFSTLSPVPFLVLVFTFGVVEMKC